MSTYSTNLALELIGTGEQAGVWGTTTNTNLGTLIEQSISGYVTQAVATGTDTTITIPNGSSGVARNMYIELTGTGGASTNLVVPANKKLYFIFNNSTGAVTVKVSGQTGVSVPTGKKMVLVSNGTDIVNGLNYIADFASNSATITHLSATSASITNLTLTSLVISNLSIASANITTLTGSTQTLSGNLTLNGGTANGVLYLNGSKVATSGTALVFDGTNLGIGTTSPTQKLDVNGGAAVTGTTPLFLQRAVIPSFDGQGAPALDWQFYSTGTTYTVGARIQGLADDAWSSTSAPTSLRFYTAPSGSTSVSERMRISNAGNVGIGTASPTSYGSGYTTLEVAGSVTGVINLKAGSTVYGQMSTEANAYKVEAVGASTSLRFLTNSAERARIDSSGNLGIGTTSPTVKLKVVASSATYTNPQVILGEDSDATGKQLHLGYNTTANTGYIQAVHNGTGYKDLLLNPNGGNLGLGVTPRAWAGGYKSFDITGPGAIASTASGDTFTQVANGAWFNGTNWIYQYTGIGAARYQMTGPSGGGNHSWHVAASGTAGNTISFTQAMTLDASGNLGVGTTSVSTGARVDIRGANNNTLSDLTAQALTVLDTTSYAQNVGGGLAFGYKYNSSGDYIARAAVIKAVKENGTDGNYATALVFATTANSASTTERARITSGGDFAVGTTSSDPISGNVTGHVLYGGGAVQHSRDNDNVMFINRKSSDGNLVQFYQDGTIEGSISVSGNTVSYNAFAGSHWSQLQDGSKPDILRGTVMESINELCVWPGEQNERLPKSKVSDTAGSKKVYGVFMAWDNDWATTNDMYVTAVGAFICRVNASVTVQEGDLLESNGDGTARVQADDIIRSSTIGKVTSTVKTHQYGDGSYCVPTVLYCG
jgi:hypothetical protein